MRKNNEEIRLITIKYGSGCILVSGYLNNSIAAYMGEQTKMYCKIGYFSKVTG